MLMQTGFSENIPFGLSKTVLRMFFRLLDRNFDFDEVWSISAFSAKISTFGQYLDVGETF